MQHLRALVNAINETSRPNDYRANQQLKADDFSAEAEEDENVMIANSDITSKRQTLKVLNSQRPAEQLSQSEAYNRRMLSAAIKQYLALEDRYLPLRPWVATDARSPYRPSHRTVAVEHMSSLHDEFQLRFQTFMLGVNIFDRYMSTAAPKNADDVSRTATVSAFLAMKIEEVYAPTLSNLIEPYKENITKALEEEERIIKALNFDFRKISPYGYLAGLQNTSKLNPKEEQLTHYLLELYYHNNDMMGVESYSLVALAIDQLVRIYRLGNGGWENALGKHTREKVKETASKLYEYALRCKTQHIKLYRKYASGDYESISRDLFFGK